ncbi:hypothetical protein OSTOST_19633 [Ostertagia ostertagi]
MKPSAIADALNEEVMASTSPPDSCHDNATWFMDIVADEPSLSVSTIVRRTGIPRSSVRRILKKHGYKSVSKVSTILSAASLIISVQRLLPKLEDDFVKRIVFSDEKLFLISPPRNRNNDRLWTTLKKSELSPSVLQSPRSNSQRGLMVWAGVSWNGKTDLLLVEPGLKINADYYIAQLRDEILPSCSRLYPHGNFVLQQDWAPAHAARKTVEFLESVDVEYLKKTEYPSASPDLNPLDYRVWAELNRTVYDGQEVASLVDLRQRSFPRGQNFRFHSYRRRLRNSVIEFNVLLYSGWKYTV